MEKVLRIIDRMSEWTGKGASYLVMAMVLCIMYEVVMRYFFDRPQTWVFDTTYMLYGAHAMLGAAYCHYTKGHVRMDLLYGRLRPRTQAIVDVVCYLLLFFPLFIVLVYKIGGHALWAVSYGERASASSWRPILGPFKLAIALGVVLFFLQGIADFIRSLHVAVKGASHES
ncbi:MAG: transporter [Deltaproteobacteria bacterium]|nr:MAG: transporter [Deltaproteobacteria bacterium]